MKSAFKILAYIIAAEVAIQSMAMVFGVAGLLLWVDGGGTLDAAALEDDNLSFTGLGGIILHGINGMMVIPLLALVLLIMSFFTKLPGAIRNAAMVLGLVIVQVMLGLFGHESAYVGGLHGLNALVLFSAALYTGMAARKATREEISRETLAPAQV